MLSYKKAVKGWIKRKITGKGVALRHPIKATYKAKRYHTRLKKYGTGIIGHRTKGYEWYRKYTKENK